MEFINKGKLPGFQLDSGADYIGWVNVTKLFVNQRLLDLHANDPDSPVYKQEKLAWEKPYRVHIQELCREAYNDDIKFPTNEDYRRNEIHRFYNLYEVEEFLQSLGKAFTDLKWPVDYLHY